MPYLGYTGEDLGYEISVHPDRAAEVWDMILGTGAPLGVLAAGLGARDSTRTEAGLPLFGHEIEGEHALTLTEAGYGFVVRFHVPFFVGREAYIERTRRSRRHVLRLAGKGRKSVRPGHVILDAAGDAAGVVTSFAYTDAEMNFRVLAAVRGDFAPEPGEAVRAARVAASGFASPAKPSSVVDLKALPRFPDDDERAEWRRNAL